VSEGPATVPGWKMAELLGRLAAANTRIADLEMQLTYSQGVMDGQATRIAELKAENKDLRRDDEMLRRALSNMGRWAVDDILGRYPATKRKGCDGLS